MARVLVVAKLYPEDINIDLDKIVENLKQKLPENYEITKYTKEPIAFGLSALRIFILIPEESEGGTSKLEEILQSIEGVQEIEIEAVHRLSEY